MRAPARIPAALALIASLAACGQPAKPATPPHAAPPAARTSPPTASSLAILPIVGVTASSFNTGYPPSQAIDNSLSTWWSANGTGQWINIDTGASRSINAVQIGFYRGNVRRATFHVEVSTNNSTWTRVLTNATSSGTTLAQQRFTFPVTTARWVRIVNQGNTENTAAAYTEIDVEAPDTTTAPVATFNPSPPALSFPSQTLNTTSTARTITLQNTGNASMNISVGAMTGANAGEFNRTTTCTTSLAAGASCAFSVTFTPTATGTRNAAFSVTTNAAGSPHNITLTGTGATAPVTVTATPSSVTFPGQRVSTTSGAQIVTFKNTGSTSVTVSSVGLAGANPADFLLGADSDPATPDCRTASLSLASQASCTVAVSFRPAALDARSATLNVVTSASTTATSVPLNGTGTGPKVTLTPSPLPAFPTTQVFSDSALQEVILSNTGTLNLILSNVNVTGTHAADFVIDATSTCKAGTTVAPGGTCAAKVKFNPKDIGTRTADLTFTNDALGSPHKVAMTGTGAGTPAASLTPATFNFGTFEVNTVSPNSVFTLKNTGNAPLTLSSVALSGANAAQFAIQSQTCSTTSPLAALASCTITVAYRPVEVSTGAHAASLVIAHNAAGSPSSSALSGTGIAAGSGTPGATAAPTTLFFDQKIGGTSAAQTVTLTSTGTAGLTVSGVTVTGVDASRFSVSAQTCTTAGAMTQNTTCTASVTFTPIAIGLLNANLVFNTNAGDQSVELRAFGHQISNPPTSGVIAAFSGTDALNLETYTGSLLIQVIRNGQVIGVVRNPSAGTDGSYDINHVPIPVQNCFGTTALAGEPTTTPDIRAGDIVRVTTSEGVGDQMVVDDLTITANATNPNVAVTREGNQLIVRGTAKDANGNPLPTNTLEHRLIADGEFVISGKQRIQAPGHGTLVQDGINWTATYTLSEADMALALAESNENLIRSSQGPGLTAITIQGFDDVGGPAGPTCTQ